MMAADEGATPELRATVREAPQGSSWPCLLTGDMVPSESAIRAASARPEAVAAGLDGEYDGWEAAVTH